MLTPLAYRKNQIQAIIRAQPSFCSIKSDKMYFGNELTKEQVANRGQSGSALIIQWRLVQCLMSVVLTGSLSIALTWELNARNDMMLYKVPCIHLQFWYSSKEASITRLTTKEAQKIRKYVNTAQTIPQQSVTSHASEGKHFVNREIPNDL